MPVILPCAAESRWLSEEVGAAEAMQLLLPFPSDQMAVAEVSALVGNPDNDTAELFDPSYGAGPPPDEQLSLI